MTCPACGGKASHRDILSKHTGSNRVCRHLSQPLPEQWEAAFERVGHGARFSYHACRCSRVFGSKRAFSKHLRSCDDAGGRAPSPVPVHIHDPDPHPVIPPLATDVQVEGAAEQLTEVTRGLAYSFPTDTRAADVSEHIYDIINDFNADSGVSSGRGKGVREAQSYLALSHLHTALDGARTRGHRQHLIHVLDTLRTNASGRQEHTLGVMIYHAVILPLWRRLYEPEEGKPAERVLPEDDELFNGQAHGRTEDFERLARKGRYAAALNGVRALDSAGSGPLLTIAQTKDRVAAKCPQDPQPLPSLEEMPAVDKRGGGVDFNALALRLGEGGRARAQHLSREYGAECVTLTHEDIAGALESAKKRSSPGVDGLTSDILRKVFWGDEEKIKALTTFLNRFLEGRVTDLARKVFIQSRVAIIPKDNGDIRPLGIGGALYRLVNRAVLRKVLPDLSKTLQPTQYAVGLPDGGAILAQIMGHIHAEGVREEGEGRVGKDILKVDIRNAYNSILLRAVYEALRTHYPPLIRWFLLSHTGGSAQFSGRGVEFCTTMRIRQGDPLGSLFFALGIIRATREVSELLGGAAAPDSDQRELTVAGYADDTYLVGDGVDLCEQLSSVKGIFYNRAGLVLNPAKSELLTTASPGSPRYAAVKEAAAKVGVPVVSAISVVGVPVGDAREVDARAERKVRGYIRELSLLNHFRDPRLRWEILSKCLSTPRIVHLLRGLTPRSTLPRFGDALGDFSDAVYESALGILGVETVDVEDAGVTQSLLEAPPNFGGMGLRLPGNVPFALAQQMGSVNSTSRFLEKSFPPLARSFTQSHAETSRQVHALDDGKRKNVTVGVSVKSTHFSLRTITPFPADGEGAPTHDRSACHKAAAQCMNDAHLRDVTKAIEKLRLQPHTKHYAAAVISGADADASKWVSDCTPGFRGVVGGSFVQAARMRLAIPPLLQTGESGSGWCRVARAKGPPCAKHAARHHALDCEGRSMAWRVFQRHDEIRDLWASAISKLDDCGGIQKEHTWKVKQDGVKVVSDIEFNKGGKHYVLDISLTSPSLPSYSERASRELEYAAALRWQEKHTKYWDAVHENEAMVTLPELRRVRGVVPIIYETSGRLYSETREWAERVLFKNEKSRLSSLLSACSCLMARRVGEALHEGALWGMGSAR